MALPISAPLCQPLWNSSKKDRELQLHLLCSTLHFLRWKDFLVIHSQNFEKVAENVTLFKCWKNILSFTTTQFFWSGPLESSLAHRKFGLISNYEKQCCYMHLIKLEMCKIFLIMSSGKIKFSCTECLYTNWIKRSIITSIMFYMGLPLNNMYWTYY